MQLCGAIVPRQHAGRLIFCVAVGSAGSLSTMAFRLAVLLVASQCQCDAEDGYCTSALRSNRSPCTLHGRLDLRISPNT